MTTPQNPEIELALISKAMSGDAGGLYQITSNLMDEGVPFDAILFDHLLAAERSVGQRWAQGDFLVAEEHAVTAAIETVISLLIGMFDQPEGAPAVVVTTAEGDDHSLPARAAAANLLYEGYRTTFLGANVPGADLRDFLESATPVALVLSGAMTTHLLGARSVVAAAHDAGVPVVAGGKAFGPDGRWAEVAGVDIWVESLRDVVEVVEGLVAGDVPELSAQPDLPKSVQSLIDQRSTVLATAEGSLGEKSPSRLSDEVALLVGALEATLLTGDDEIVVDMLEWQTQSLTAYGFEPDVVADAVESAIADLPEARETLVRARASRS